MIEDWSSNLNMTCVWDHFVPTFGDIKKSSFYLQSQVISCWVSAILWLVSKNITTSLLYTGWPELKMSVTAPPATEAFHLLFRNCPQEHDIISHQWVFTTWISHKYALIYLFLVVVCCVMRAALLCGETIKYKSSCSETVNPALGWNVVMSVSWYLVMLIPASSAFQLNSDQREDYFFQIFQVFSRSSFVLDLLSLGCSAGSIYGDTSYNL